MTTSISGTSGTTPTTNTSTSTTNNAPNSIGYSSDQSSSHVFGLASGMDVDSMVKKMMDAASIPLIQMEQQKQLLEWQLDDYRTANSQLLDLKNQTFNMSLQGTFLTKQVSSSDDTKLTATAGPNTPNTMYTINSASMATAATKNSQQKITSSTTYDGSQSFWDSRNDFTNGVSWTQQPITGETVSGSGTSFQLASGYIDGTPTLKDGSTSLNVTTDLNAYNASGLTYDAYVDQTTGQVTLRNAPNSGALTASYTVDKSIDFSISTYDSSGKQTTQNFSFAPTDNLNTMISKVNSSNLGISAFYSSYSQKVSFSRNQTGNLNLNGDEIDFSSSSPNANFLTSTLGLSSETGGSDGVLNLNGVDITSHTNTFSVNGTTYTLNGNIINGTDPAVTLNVTNDTQGAFDSIKAWVDKYNSTIDALNSKLAEKRNRDYPPLTNQQMSSMSATQIDQWTAQAKSGMLANDQVLGSGLSQMRQDLYTPVTNSSKTETYTQLAQIGITTSSNYLDNGKLEINDDQLKQALAADPQSVMDLFTKTSDNYSEQGVMQRLNTTLTNTMSQITQKAGSASSVYTQYDLGQQLNDFDTRISDFQTQLDQLQTRYYNQFSAMETAINSANQQSAYIQNNFN
jgi:flagellar hook-associated protein 2